MSTERLFSLKNPWFTWSVGGVIATALISVLVGFVWVPYKQNDKTITGLWDAICRAAGVASATESPGKSDGKVIQSSEVIVSPQMLASDNLSVGRGATLAMRCTMCHGVRGMSEASTPNLAGQYAEAIYKQLRDYKSGHRESAVMAPLVRDLSDQDMRDLASYYAYLPKLTQHNTLGDQLKAPAIVQVGSPMRNIAPCASCHGGSDVKTASPLLDGEPASYIRDQLYAFANGTRRNDIHGQMRNIARQMTPEEIEIVARYYSRR
ncbi:c-type cytochrome [Noviherbaspirillum sp.]|uniref:c-type cytochrome n=1 Tax=Noviherbaspirillum sp. TaxID=1926288 RepID=UPI002FE3330D